MSEPKWVKVHWTDAWHDHDQAMEIDDAAASEVSDRVSIGYLVAEDETKMVIAMTYGVMEKAERVQDFMAIPRGCITNVVYEP